MLGKVWTGRGRPAEGFLTERMAQEQLNEILADARRGLLVVPERAAAGAGGPTVRDAVEEWLRYTAQERNARATTLREYRATTYKHLIPVFGEERLEAVTTRRLETWRNQLLAGGLKRRTVNKILTNTHGIFERARRVYGLASNPVEDVERLRENYDPGNYDVYSKEEVWALVRAACEITYVADPWEPDFDADRHQLEAEVAFQDGIIFLTLAFSGLRLGEALGLRWRDVDFANSLIRVTQQRDGMGNIAAPKGKRVRAVPMVQPLAKELAELGTRDYATGDDDPVFVGIEYARRWYGAEGTEQQAALIVAPLDRWGLGKRYKKAQERAGLRPLRMHDLRHTFGTLAVNFAHSGKELQAWMGHANYATTERYLHYKQQDDAAARLAPAFAEPTTQLEQELERAAQGG